MRKIYSLFLTTALLLSGVVFAEQTLSIIKPDAVAKHHVGDILALFEANGLTIVGLKMVKLNENEAKEFYSVHKERPFFAELVKFVSSGPVVAIVLDGPEAIVKNRTLMGATDPKKAEAESIRARYASSVTQNAVHGSDSPEAAKKEIAFFFKPSEIFSK